MLPSDWRRKSSSSKTGPWRSWSSSGRDEGMVIVAGGLEFIRGANSVVSDWCLAGDYPPDNERPPLWPVAWLLVEPGFRSQSRWWLETII